MPRGSSGSAAPGPKSLSTGETLRWAALFLRPYKWRAAVNPSFAVLSVAFAIAFPQLTQYIVDDLNDHRLESLLPSVLMLLLVFLCRDLFQSIRLMVNNRFEQNVVYDMRCAVYEQLQKLPMSYLSERASGDLITRILDDIAAIERLLIEGSEQGAVAVLSIVIVAAILFAKNPALATATLMPLPLLVIGWGFRAAPVGRNLRERLALDERSAFG